ncbi:MAG: hypothetical protein DRP50_07900, partial [Thermotoga sp.]
MKIIHLKRAKMEVTPFGGLLLVHDFIRNIGLEAFVKDRFPAPGSNRGRSPLQFISSTILMQHAGGRKVIDIETIRYWIFDTSLDSRTRKEGVLGIIVRQEAIQGDKG